MQFYATLVAITLAVAIMALATWFKTRCVAFIVGFFFIYNWTLQGAWYLIRERMGYGGDGRFEYLYYKVFPVYLDTDYLWTLWFYGLFILSIGTAVLLKAHRGLRQPRLGPIRISHSRIIMVAAICSVTGFFIIKDALGTAADLNSSGYVIVSTLTPLWTVFQILNETSLVSLAVGFAIWLSGNKGIYITGDRRWFSGLIYLTMLVAVMGLNSFLGNRTTPLFSFTTMGLFYVANNKRINWPAVLLGGVVTVAVVILPGITRDEYKMKAMKGKSWGERILYLVTEGKSSVEALAAHISMYGSLHKHLPLTYGSSFVSLAASIIPHSLWPERPPEIYVHYATGVRAVEGQGYTIHHATAWYLNFGFAGVLAGGFLLGWIWAVLFNACGQAENRIRHFRRVFMTTAFWTFTGFIPTLLRVGPEGYKGLTIEALLIPAAVFTFASLRLALKNGRPIIAPLHTFENRTALLAR